MKKLILAAVFMLIPSLAFATVDRMTNATDMTVNGDRLGSIVWPVENGGRGAIPLTIGSRNQGYTSTITVSNFNGSTSTISNALNYKFNSGTQIAPILNPAFTFSCGNITPSTISSTHIASSTPQNAGTFGIYCVDFIAYTNNLELVFTGAGSNAGSFDVMIDDELVFSASSLDKAGTAQAGSASTITLASSGSSSTNGFYNQQYVYISGGAGIGQRKRIVGYVGATKVATVDSEWSVEPDNTSTYVVSPSAVAYSVIGAGVTSVPNFAFSGEMRPHKVRIVSSAQLQSVNVNSYGIVLPIKKTHNTKMVFVTDSFGAGFGNGSWQTSYPFLLARTLGYDIENLGVGSTGIVTDNAGANTSYVERTTPPTNSWQFSVGNPSAGTYTLHQGETEIGPIAYNANLATVQSAFLTAFGAGKVKVLSSCSGIACGYLVIATDEATKLISTAMTLDTSSMTVGTRTPWISRYTGDLDQVLPTNEFGDAEPFVLWIQGSGNDSTQTAKLQAVLSNWLVDLHAKYPKAQIILSGMWMNKGPMTDANFKSVQSILHTASSELPLINGVAPYVNTWDEVSGVGYMNGDTTVLAPSGTAGINSDILVGNNTPHPSSVGHFFLADYFATYVANILAPK